MMIRKSSKNTVHVRIMAQAEAVEAIAEQVGQALENAGYEMVESSEPYPCRTPQEDQSRVYLTLLKREDK